MENLVFRTAEQRTVRRWGVQAFGHVQQIARGTGQAVQPGNDNHIVVAYLSERTGQLGSVALGTGQLLLKQPPTACVAQRPALKGEILVVGLTAGSKII